jgi:hypothetical protein
MDGMLVGLMGKVVLYPSSQSRRIQTEWLLVAKESPTTHQTDGKLLHVLSLPCSPTQPPTINDMKIKPTWTRQKEKVG